MNPEVYQLKRILCLASIFSLKESNILTSFHENIRLPENMSDC